MEFSRKGAAGPEASGAQLAAGGWLKIEKGSGEVPSPQNREMGTGVPVPYFYAQLMPALESGNCRRRFPLAAKIALAAAGKAGGKCRHRPNPSAGLFDFSQCTSISVSGKCP